MRRGSAQAQSNASKALFEYRQDVSQIPHPRWPPSPLLAPIFDPNSSKRWDKSIMEGGERPHALRRTQREKEERHVITRSRFPSSFYAALSRINLLFF